jgi:hypothetical protein
MKIRYQNGAAIEAMTLFRTEEKMRIALRGGDDVMEVTNIHGAWISDDCEPVTLETETTGKSVLAYSDDEFICPARLAANLLSPLYIDSVEDLFEEPAPLHARSTGTSTLIA